MQSQQSPEVFGFPTAHHFLHLIDSASWSRRVDDGVTVWANRPEVPNGINYCSFADTGEGR
jgi:hypothetical protein